MRANLDITRALLEAAPAQSAVGGPTSILVFSSGVASTAPTLVALRLRQLPRRRTGTGTRPSCAAVVREYLTDHPDAVPAAPSPAKK